MRRDAAGKPLADGEAVILMDVERKKNGVRDDINLRGVGPAGLAINKQLRLTSGRMFRPGADELIVGRKAAAEYAGLGVGSHIALRGVDWTVVGEFEDGGGIGETEMLTDAPTELAAFARADPQSVIAELGQARRLCPVQRRAQLQPPAPGRGAALRRLHRRRGSRPDRGAQLRRLPGRAR